MKKIYHLILPSLFVSVTALGQNVGIGTSTPSEKLDVSGNVKTDKVIDAQDPTYFIDPANSGTAGVFAGSIGIGTATPGAKLHLYGNNYSLFGPNTTWGAYLRVGGNGNVTNDASVAATNGNLHIDGAAGILGTYLNWYHGNDGVYFGNGTGGGAGRMTGGGYLGVGTTTPTYALHVTTPASGNWQGLFSNGSSLVYLAHQGGYGMHINTGGSNSSGRYGLEVRNADQTHFYVRDDGYVGVGTTTPGYKFDVAGDIHASGNYYGKIHVDDTRSTDPGPDQYDNQVYFEFKTRSAVGVPGSGSYSGMMTIAPWGDNSGDKHHQLNFNNDGIYYRTGSPNDATWSGAWKKIVTDDVVNAGFIQNQWGGNQSANFHISGSGRTGSSMYSPIYYDDNDPNYYADLNGVSRMNQVSSFYEKNNYGVGVDHPYGMYFDNGLSTDYAIYREPGAWTGPFPDLRIAFHTGIKLGAYTGYGGTRFYNNSDMATEIMSVGNGDNHTRVHYNLYAPIMLDINNPGYYVDPDASSNFNNTRTNGELYYNNWMRHMTGSQSGLYWQEGTGQYWHIYPNSQADMIFRTGSGNGGIMGTIGDDTPRGYLHYTTTNEIGLLHEGRGWQIRAWNGAQQLYGTTYTGSIIDENDNAWYWNGNGVSRQAYTNTVNDSWLPYSGNNYNYLRNVTYAWNAHWYDENNAGFYLNPDNTNRLSTIYLGTAAYSNSGWTTGIINTETQSDGHQYNPLVGNWGYLGTSGQYWWYSYAATHVNMSQRSLKKDITPVDKGMSEYLVADIDKIKPTFYKFNEETDEMQEGNEPKYRPQMRLGVILDETPDYIQDGAFSGVDIYSLATLGIAGVKHNREEIKEIKEMIGANGGTINISDFGTGLLANGEVWVPFAADFIAKNSNGAVPIVTVTPTGQTVSLSITETTDKGFKVAGTSGVVNFNWIAMAKVQLQSEEVKPLQESNPQLAGKLVVDEATKQKVRNYWEAQKQNSLTAHEEQMKEHEKVSAQGNAHKDDTKNYKPELPANYKPASEVAPYVPAGEDPSPMKEKK